jgi:hypothetical protein
VTRLFSCMITVAVAGSLLACGGDDPVNFSAPVAINLKSKSDDVKTGGVISDEKGITTESGNPFGAFMKDARAALGGKDPGRIELSEASLLLGAGSKGVVALEDVFSGKVEILFIVDDTNDTFPAAHIDSVSGSGPLGLTVDFDDALLGTSRAKFYSGSFKVVVRGTAATPFQSKGLEAALQTTFRFAAFQ